MTILGLDPGIARTGFGLVSVSREPTYINCGMITTPSTQETSDRLHCIGQDLHKLIDQYHPDQAIVETVLFGNNTKTAMLTAEVRGVLIYTLRNHHIPVTNLTPLQIKSRLTGYGNADKHQVQQVVQARLSLTAPPNPDDAADALAGALCIADQTALISV